MQESKKVHQIFNDQKLLMWHLDSIRYGNLHNISKTKRFSRGATVFVFVALHVNTEKSSVRCSEGQSSRFSMIFPEFCSISSSISIPFRNQDTLGFGRPAEWKQKLNKKLNEKCLSQWPDVFRVWVCFCVITKHICDESCHWVGFYHLARD
jgi:hypothetical protein